MTASAEDIEQIKVIEYLRQRHPDIPVIHIANQRTTSPQHGRLLKRMGVTPGVSDLFFPRGNNDHNGMWLELKTDIGKPTQLQLDFICAMMKEGYYGIVCYGSKQAIDTINLFYSLKE